MNYQVKTDIFEKCIIQTVENKRFDGIVEQISKQVSDTQETQFREGLIKLGWAPPYEETLPVVCSDSEQPIALSLKAGGNNVDNRGHFIRDRRMETMEEMDAVCWKNYGKSYLQVLSEQKGSVLKTAEAINKNQELPSMELVSG